MDKGDLRQAYGLVRRFTKPGTSHPNIPCKPDGSLPHSDGEVLQIWQDYLQTERQMELRTSDWEPLFRPDANALPHSWEEIAQALNSLKIGKTTRQGSIPAVLLRGLQDILLPHLVHIFDDAAGREYPTEWATCGLFWLSKPGKTGLVPANFRDICLQEAVAKAYSQCLLWRVKEQLVCSCLPTQFGFLPGRGTQDALAIARELQCRARRCRQHLMIASFDLSQAFYKVDRTLLEEILFQRLDEDRAALQVCRKLDNLVYRLSQGDQILELTAPHGVTVGDTLGPLLFVVYMDAFLRDLQSSRAAQRWPLPLVGLGRAFSTGTWEDKAWWPRLPFVRRRLISRTWSTLTTMMLFDPSLDGDKRVLRLSSFGLLTADSVWWPMLGSPQSSFTGWGRVQKS